MIHVALYQPEIPPNTGNIIRLCANAGVALHLIHPLGFDLNEKQVRRAGLDYHELTQVYEYADYQEFLKQHSDKRIFACTTKGSSHYHQCEYQSNDILLFGPETRGLPTEILSTLPGSQKIRIPMRAESRSLNLANSVSIILYEALRQQDFNRLELK